MQQKSPLMWFSLCFMFIISLALFTISNYFIFPPKKLTLCLNNKKELKSMNMMTKQFSIFEPSSSLFSNPLNRLSTFFGILFLPMSYWVSPSWWSIIWSESMETLHNELKSLL